MKQIFSAYPAGFAGLALLLLRGSCATFLFTVPPWRFALAPWSALIFGIIAVAIVLGMFSRIAAILCAAVAVMMIASAETQALQGLPHLLDAAALAMIGPGAFSIDARWFGRRTIHLAG